MNLWHVLMGKVDKNNISNKLIELQKNKWIECVAIYSLMSKLFTCLILTGAGLKNRKQWFGLSNITYGLWFLDETILNRILLVMFSHHTLKRKHFKWSQNGNFCCCYRYTMAHCAMLNPWSPNKPASLVKLVNRFQQTTCIWKNESSVVAEKFRVSAMCVKYRKCC